MDAHGHEPTLREVLRETLDVELGPHPVWVGSPAARRVAERQGTRWPLRALGAAAAVLVVAIGGYQFLSGGSGSGGTNATPSPSPSMIARGSFQPTPFPVGEGPLAAGTYIVHPLRTSGSALEVTFTVPDGWLGWENGLHPAGAPGASAPGGTAIQFIDVASLNDPCRWSGTADDVNPGPSVDDLVAALRAQTAYGVSDAVDVTIAGQHGKRVDIVIPDEPFVGQTPEAPGCDDGVFRLWNTPDGPHEFFVQGPANRLQTNILDVAGTRLVIVVQDFPGTSTSDRSELDAIVDSLVIER
jgi:hypothetical protein